MDPTYPLLTVAFYAGLNGLVLLCCAARVVQLRRQTGIGFGDGGNAALLRAMRGQANFVECVPFILILLILMAVIGTPAWVIHLLGLPLTLARIAHATYFLRPSAPLALRFYGAAVTFPILGLASAGLILHAAAQML